MIVEGFLTKIVAAIFKKGVIGSALETLATAYSIYTVVDAVSDAVECLDSVNDCNDLGVCALHVASDTLTEAAVDRLLEIGSDTFVVEQTSSGVYIASRFVPAFRTSSVQFPSRVASGSRGGFSTGGQGSFRTGGRGGFQ